jgi:5'-deoxy-5'-methylthioadenosine phosphorylase
VSLVGIIGGTGLDQLDGLERSGVVAAETRWGAPTAALVRGRYAGRDVVFLARHGSAHQIPPHRVNYRANIQALKDHGATAVIAVNAVGGISPRMAPGMLALPRQIIDYTYGREHTFHDGTGTEFAHVDFTEPYSDWLRQALASAAREAGLALVEGGVYGATQGPRLESAAEIERMARDGCDLVGMTGMPEAALARELDLPYACCAVVVNWAAGRGTQAIHAQLTQYVAEGMGRARSLLQAVLKRL